MGYSSFVDFLSQIITKGNFKKISPKPIKISILEDFYTFIFYGLCRLFIAKRKTSVSLDITNLQKLVRVPLAPRVGLEPTTYRLTAERSTN